MVPDEVTRERPIWGRRERTRMQDLYARVDERHDVVLTAATDAAIALQRKVPTPVVAHRR